MKRARLALVLLWLAVPAVAGEAPRDPLDPFPPAIDNTLPAHPPRYEGREPKLYVGPNGWNSGPPYPIWRI